MRKLLVLIATGVLVVSFSSTVMAVDWNFYGSARLHTFWDDRDFGDGLNAAGTDDKDTDLVWDLLGNRIGANVKAEHIAGRFELGLKGDGSGDVDVGTRRIFGVWNFGPGKLKVGKDYTPVHQFISGQIFDDDLGLLGIGTMYGDRTPQISLAFGDFEIAFVTPSSDLIDGAPGGDVDEILPKLEAVYGMSTDMFNFHLIGGYQWFKIEDVPSLVNPGDTNDLDVVSWTFGGDVGVNFGPAYVNGSISYSQNAGDANWHIPGLRTAGGFAAFDGDDGTDDTDTLMWALIAGWKINEQLTLESGFGWREDDPDGSGLQDDNAWEAYGQAVITMAPGVYIIPEIGYTDFGDSSNPNEFGTGKDDEGNRWYAGAKWQIDF